MVVLCAFFLSFLLPALFAAPEEDNGMSEIRKYVRTIYFPIDDAPQRPPIFYSSQNISVYFRLLLLLLLSAFVFTLHTRRDNNIFIRYLIYDNVCVCILSLYIELMTIITTATVACMYTISTSSYSQESTITAIISSGAYDEKQKKNTKRSTHTQKIRYNCTYSYDAIPKWGSTIFYHTRHCLFLCFSFCSARGERTSGEITGTERQTFTPRYKTSFHFVF